MLKPYEKIALAIIAIIAMVLVVLYMSALNQRDKELLEEMPNSTQVVWSDWGE